MNVPYVNLAAQHAPLKAELLRAAERVLVAGQFVLGPEVDEFEKRFAGLCRVPHAVGLNSGTDALILALRVLGIGPGDEVITAPNTFVATVSAIALTCAKPVLVDVRDDLNIDPALIEPAITPRTKAIIPVHLTGRPADMEPIMAIARRRDLYVVEDAAQAVLAEYDGRSVGSFGDLGCFSLHPLKTLNACGDAGVVTTADEGWAQRLRVLRNIGLETRDNAVAWAGNSRLDTLQAALVMVKLRHLAEWTEARRANAAFYRTALSDLPAVRVPAESPREKCVYHTFVVQAERRDELRAFLAGKGVGTAIHYPIPIHLQTAGLSLGYGKGAFPVAENQAARILSLPVHQGLRREEAEYVVAQIRAFYGL
ncbi:MAG: DegT/DnrJ/EryC1/StrS family aminotransferase [Lentisphaerae bacterium]|nr:DegT/DnrJ/EryC1/StrS family aminotransferase [Lentisphaerota bacterium]